MPVIGCILNNERSEPPALVEKSKYLTINKHGNIALFTIFYFQIQNHSMLTYYVISVLQSEVDRV